MIESILIWLAAIAYIEALVQILVESELLLPIRDAIGRRGGMLATFVGCGYCVSVWAALTVSWALPGFITSIWGLDLLIKTLVLHRLSNVFHSIIIRRMNREPLEVVIHHAEEQE